MYLCPTISIFNQALNDYSQNVLLVAIAQSTNPPAMMGFAQVTKNRENVQKEHDIFFPFMILNDNFSTF